MRFNINEHPEESDIHEIRRRLQEYNDPFWEVDDRMKVVLTLSDDNALIGGVVFTIFGEWLEVDFLWVDAGQRSQGFGRQILKEAESFAIAKGCKMSFLNTFSFQARPFYEKNGYSVVYVQNNYPVTNCKYFMEKKLSG